MDRNASRRLVAFLVAGMIVAASGPARAQRAASDLKGLPAGQQVASLRYCQGVYEVTLKDGGVRSFKEFDELRGWLKKGW